MAPMERKIGSNFILISELVRNLQTMIPVKLRTYKKVRTTPVIRLTYL